MEENKTNLTIFRNVHYKTDADYVVKIARTLLLPIGIWPLYKVDTTWKKIKMCLQTSIVFFLMCFLFIPHVVYTYFDAEDLRRMMKVIAAQVFSLLAIIKFWTVIINRKEIKYCLEQVEVHYRDIQCEEEREIMLKNAKVGRNFTIAYLGLTYCGALPYHLFLPFIADRVVKQDNTTMIPLPYLSDYLFFVVENSPLHEIFFVGQMMISLMILSTNCGIYTIITNIVMHCCCLFQVTSRQVVTIFEYKGNIRRRLHEIIHSHLRAIKFAEKIEKALNIVFLCEIGGCTIIICFLEFGFLVEMEDENTLGMITYSVLTTSIFTNVFIISYTGDRLKTENERLGQLIYFMEWYSLPKSIVHDLIIMILRCNRPARLTAGKLFDVSLQGFCDVCKTSAAYLNFLRTMVA